MDEKLLRTISKLIHRVLLNPMKKKLKYQYLWKRLHDISVSGMNIGSGVDCNISGEKFVMKYVKSKMSENQEVIIFDVGANLGQYALELLKVFDLKQSKIHCFEPSKVAFEKLKINMEGYENIICHNIGFGEKNEQLKLYTDYKGSNLASLHNLKNPFRPFDKNNIEVVEVQSIQNYCVENNINKIDFLKLDIEGHEFKALLGASNMLKTNAIKYIQFEFGTCNIDSKTYFRDFFFLLNDNYKIYRIVQDGLFPIKSYSHTDEIFLTTNYLAEHNTTLQE